MAEGSVLRVLHGQVLEPTFVDQVMRLAFESRGNGDDRRPALEAERVELTSDVERLKRAIRKVDDDDAMDVIVGELGAAVRRLKAVEQQLAVLAEPIDSARLRAALEQRIAN